VEDARGNQMKNCFFSVNNQSVPGVCAPLISNDIIGFSGKNINDFAFSFVTPLRTNNNNSWHKFPYSSPSAEPLRQSDRKKQADRI
jgi:hypothetical protein